MTFNMQYNYKYYEVEGICDIAKVFIVILRGQKSDR